MDVDDELKTKFTPITPAGPAPIIANLKGHFFEPISAFLFSVAEGPVKELLFSANFGFKLLESVIKLVIYLFNSFNSHIHVLTFSIAIMIRLTIYSTNHFQLIRFTFTVYKQQTP